MTRKVDRERRNAKVLALFEAGKSVDEIAAEVGLSSSSVRRILEWQPRLPARIARESK